MADEGEFPKINGDELSAGDGFTATRPNGKYIGGDYAATSLTTNGDLTDTITLPANTACAGYLVIANVNAEITTANSAAYGKGTLNFLSDSNATPTTVVHSVDIRTSTPAGSNLDYQTFTNATLVFFISSLTLSSANYVKVTLTSYGASSGEVMTTTCDSFTVIAF